MYVKRLIASIKAKVSLIIDFLNSEEVKKFLKGEVSIEEAVHQFDKLKQIEHEEIMDALKRREWSLSTRVNLVKRKIRKRELELSAKMAELKKLKSEKNDLD